jgi:predicted HD phosphohydrolase
MKTVFQEIEEIFNGQYSREYLGENVTLVEHALQCADLAMESNAKGELVCAALLHDIGHFLIDESVEAYLTGVDAHHDEIGAKWVEDRFTQMVVEPIRLHVDAKRYLVSSDSTYKSLLSEASLKTFEMQGGYMSEFEKEMFLSNPFSQDAIQIRLWDDKGKTRGKSHSDLRAFESLIISSSLNS